MLRLIVAGVMLSCTGFTAMAAAPPRETAEKVSDPADKIVCKRFLETGSLVKGQRICKTKADWQRDRDAAHEMNTTRACAGSGDALCR